MWPVNQLNQEEYLQGVVPAEMPATWGASALGAQAVAARTYVTKVRPAHALYDICSTTACQVYKGFSAETVNTNAAVASTALQIRNYQGSPALTQYSSSNGGWIAPGALPYQVAKEDVWDRAAEGNTNLNWTTDLTVAQLQGLFPEVGTLQQLLVTTRDGKGDFGGRVTGVKVIGATKTTTLTGEAFRSKTGLKSTYFTVQPPSPITDKWNALGGPNSIVGSPLNAEYDVKDGRARNFQRGLIYYNVQAGAHEVHGGIMDKYLSIGASNHAIRFPITDEVAVTGGAENTFQHGAIYWSPGPGAKLILGAIFDRFTDLGGVTYMGMPTEDERAVGGAQRSRFVNGAIYWTPATGAHSIVGGINARYEALGGPASFLGAPTADEAAVGAGAVSSLKNGRIYWTSATGAIETYGAILAKYLTLGGPTQNGFPATVEVPVGNTAARFQIFGNSYIYWSAPTGAHRVWGAILGKYLSVNAANGALGLPIGDESGTATTSAQEFQHGYIIWSAGDNSTTITMK
jgi:SpoIID/LytB domain protein